MSKTTRNLVLGVLFFLPVVFLLFLYPSTHNYTPLDIVNKDVKEISESETIKLKDHLTVLAFFGKQPLSKAIAASNLKELVYDKFKGFKTFQIVVMAPSGYEKDYNFLKKEVERYEDLRFWHYVFTSDENIKATYNSLKYDIPLDENLCTEEVFLIDKDLNQRGRLDDRDDSEVEKSTIVYGLNSYNCIEIEEVKNKMNDDMRILFTEYRQKRKGKFDSSSRRANDLKANSNE
ncbi:hypothetical protein RM697_03580 [Ichthyenterobacterium sp. W332]|uniref:Uncharacterized protein n=1 Tax=Microcosmobacter mediterraneus TaxID=3075607 RepID=A0ABU2YIJ8_9FLAO|nr:hypothetical protein [Ichthyenterobacterium sp. W332]MDT0557711.1 hypothetical protein [Ichthyenterobacterium sp. W332]